MNTRTRDVCAGWSVEPEDIGSGAGQSVGVSACRRGQEPARGVHAGLGSQGEVGR